MAVGVRIPTPSTVKQDTVAEQLSQDGTLPTLQRLTRLPIANGRAELGVAIVAGANQVAHGLARQARGCFATSVYGAAFVISNQVNGERFIEFDAVSDTTVDLWVF